MYGEDMIVKYSDMKNNTKTHGFACVWIREEGIPIIVSVFSFWVTKQTHDLILNPMMHYATIITLLIIILTHHAFLGILQYIFATKITYMMIKGRFQ